jgi:hypothetical protein
VGVEHGQRVARPAHDPLFEVARGLEEQRVQQQGRQREVVDPVDALCNLDLLGEVRVHLDQHLQPERAGERGELVDEGEGFGQHETAAAGLLDGVAHGIEANHLHAAGGQSTHDRFEVGAALRVLHVDVDLLRREGGPQRACLAVGQMHRRERCARARAVDGAPLGLADALRKHGVERQEQAVVHRGRAVPREVHELR